jgi:hypothetical protein
MSLWLPDVRHQETPTFLCWDKDNSEEDDAEPVRAWEPDWAAKEFAQRRYADSDYPKEQRICVKDVSGAAWLFTVTAEPDVRFVAREETT